MRNTKIIIKSKSQKYPIYIGYNILKNLGKLVKYHLPHADKIAIISDKKLPHNILKKIKYSLKKYKVKNYSLISNEKTKDIRVANKLLESLLKNNYNRSDVIISLGGGILGDLSGFVASIFKRGIKFINVPTTLLAQVDASIGGKTAVNSKQGKNLIGSFHQPEFVLSDISVLNSLPSREMICGYGEILKHSLIMNKKFFFWLKKNAKNILVKRKKNSIQIAIVESCKIKSKVVSMDEKEQNLRMILNFGHTFGHAFEAAKKFSDKLNHGEAVLLGMYIASELSFKKKLLSNKDLVLIKKHYSEVNLPKKISSFFKRKDINKIINFMKKDKKNLNQKINLVLLKRIGKTTNSSSIKVKVSEIKKILNSQLN